MTLDQFKQTQRKEAEKTADAVNYFTCIFFIGYGLWLILDIIINHFHHSGVGNSKYWGLMIPFVFVLLGVYGIRQIPQAYRVASIASARPVEEKWSIVNEYLLQLNIRSKTIEEARRECRYRNRYLNYLLISLYLDEDKILYNVRSYHPALSKGLTDFGVSNRATQRLKKFLEDHL